MVKKHDIHVHVPAGAIEGRPSAGITMATAIASRVTCQPVRSDTAMTGEITLSGMVLPIGGLKEKALPPSARASSLIIPRRNERDIDDIPEALRKKMKFTLVDSVDEVLDAALQSGRGVRARSTRVECGLASGSRRPMAAKKSR